MKLITCLLLLSLAAGAEPLDLTYDSVVALALQRNLSLLTRSLDTGRAQARYDEAVAQRNPTLGVWGIYENKSPNVIRGFLPDSRFVAVAEEIGYHPDNLYVDSQNTILVRPSLYVPIYTGGRLESAMHVQQALLEAQRWGEQRTRQQVAVEARLQYLDTLLARENTDVARQVLLQARETARLALSRQRAGVANRYDVMQSEVSVSTGQEVVILTEGSLAKARTDLAALLNLPILTEFHQRDQFPFLAESQPPERRTLEQLVAQSLSQRPELEEIRQRILAERERSHQARAGMLPQLTANLNYDIAGATVDPRGGFSLLTSLLLPIFDGGLSSSQVEEFRLRELQMSRRESQQIQRIVLEVQHDRLEVEEAHERLEAARTAEVRAREAVRLAGLRFGIGAGTSLELVSAQTVLANAQFALAQARHHQLVVRAALSYALGEHV